MLLFSVLTFLIAPSLGARILGIAPIPSYSHQVFYRPLWRELSLRGHQVTVLTTDPMKDPSLTNLTEIDLHASYHLWNELDIVYLSQLGFLEKLKFGTTLANNLLAEQLQYPEIQALIKDESKHFDLIMVEVFYPAMYAFAERFKCPFIGISSADTFAINHIAVGNPLHPVLNPDFLLPISGDLSFSERLFSCMYTLLDLYYVTPDLYHSQQLLVYKHFGNHYPLLEDIIKNVSMLFLNINPIFHQIRPLVPATIPIGGGTHLTSSKPLPKELQEQLDGATNGFIYFSLGSNVKSKDLPENIRRMILETFAELPYLVLWKFEDEKNLANKPGNVVVSKWFPQLGILKHPNIKLFITQGGLQSLDEAIYNYVPIVGMPFAADQPMNIQKIVQKGFGLSVDYATLDKATFKNAVLEVITNPKYRNSVKELAEATKDQPMAGLERAIWWTEYVLRHKGARHLRSPAVDLPSYQYFLLDVIGFCLLVVALVIILITKVVKLFVRFIKYFIAKPKLKTQ